MEVTIENVITIGGKHYHINDIAKITYDSHSEGENIIIGRINYIYNECLTLDYSENYISQTTTLYYKNIKSIEVIDTTTI